MRETQWLRYGWKYRKVPRTMLVHEFRGSIVTAQADPGPGKKPRLHLPRLPAATQEKITL